MNKQLKHLLWIIIAILTFIAYLLTIQTDYMLDDTQYEETQTIQFTC
jgi:hypothetical protein